jgi:hypothetical protein
MAHAPFERPIGIRGVGAHVRFTANFLSALSPPRQVIRVVVRCALAGAGARKVKSEMKQAIPTALLRRQTTSGQVLIRESAILALRPISWREVWRTWPESAGRDV